MQNSFSGPFHIHLGFFDPVSRVPVASKNSDFAKDILEKSTFYVRRLRIAFHSPFLRPFILRERVLGRPRGPLGARASGLQLNKSPSQSRPGLLERPDGFHGAAWRPFWLIRGIVQLVFCFPVLDFAPCPPLRTCHITFSCPPLSPSPSIFLTIRYFISSIFRLWYQ